jgi:glycosyltransferase involved in cell wall biosynthesis
MKACDNIFVNQSPDKLELSVVVISLNEQDNIVRLLNSVKWASEVIVYDSGSVDDTVIIAEKMGAKVIKGPWLGFGLAKKTASLKASYDWVLSLDCDEECTAELYQEIKNKFKNLQEATAYKIPRLSFYLNTTIRHGGWYPDYQIRLFNKKMSMWDEAKVHEKIVAQNYENLFSDLNHYVFKNIEQQVATNNRYSGLQAEEMRAKGRQFSWFHFFTKPYVKFVECYILKLGFLDGWAGYFIARSAAYSVFLKWSKLYEIQKLKGKS